MDEKKHTESQSGLGSSPNGDLISEDTEIEQDSESLKEVSNETESKNSESAERSSGSASLDNFDSEAAETVEMPETQPEIQPSDKPSEDLPEATAATVAEKKAAADALESDKDLVDDKQGSPEETATSAENKEAPENERDAEADDVKAQTQIGQMADGDNEQTGDYPDAEMPETSARKISLTKASVSAALILAVFCGFFIFDNKSKIKTIKKETSRILEDQKVFRKQQKQKPLKHPAKESNSIYDSKIKEISTLRETLLHKQKEVGELKKNYQNGIGELEKEISDELQRAEISTFLQAMENKRVEFGLRTIQRRQAYIRQLERPQNWIFEASEELLYLKRRAMVDLEVAEIASGIDMDKHMRHMDAALQKYRPTADKLAMEMPDAQAESLETIWERIENTRMQNTAVRSHSKNKIIAEQICSGDFKRLTELTEISAEAAKCITEIQGSDLFLNGLTEISPGAARHLFQWKGSWICLNGIRALSPRVAHYLFQWDGNWISLNGLTEFPAEIGETLLQWNGSQLELMGLKTTNDSPGKIGIEYLAQWERSGGRLFVPGIVRKKIEALNRESTGT